MDNIFHRLSYKIVHMGNMHMGELLEDRVTKAISTEKDLTISKIMERMGYTRNSFYKWVTKDTLSFDILRAVGRIIKYDFSQDIPEMKIDSSVSFREGLAKYGNCEEKLEAALNECDAWKQKFIDAQRDLIELKDKYIKVLEQGAA